MEWHIPVLLGCSRTGRRSIHVATLVHDSLRAEPQVTTELLDLAHYRFPLMEQRLSEMTAPPPGLQDFSDRLQRADALFIVAPEYKNGYPGVLKNAFDYLGAGIFRHKPIAIGTVSSGGFGGLNCLAQLRLVCLALGGLPIPDRFPVSRVNETFDADGRLLDDGLTTRLDEVVHELLGYTEALAHHPRKQAVVPA